MYLYNVSIVLLVAALFFSCFKKKVFRAIAIVMAIAAIGFCGYGIYQNHTTDVIVDPAPQAPQATEVAQPEPEVVVDAELVKPVLQESKNEAAVAENAPAAVQQDAIAGEEGSAIGGGN